MLIGLLYFVAIIFAISVCIIIMMVVNFFRPRYVVQRSDAEKCVAKNIGRTPREIAREIRKLKGFTWWTYIERDSLLCHLAELEQLGYARSRRRRILPGQHCRDLSDRVEYLQTSDERNAAPAQ